MTLRMRTVWLDDTGYTVQRGRSITEKETGPDTDQFFKSICDYLVCLDIEGTTQNF